MHGTGGAKRARARRKTIRALVALGTTALLVAACDVPTALPRFRTTLAIPTDSVRIPVTGQNASVSVNGNLAGVDESVGDRVRGGALVVDAISPAGTTGTLAFRIDGGGTTTEGVVDVAAGAGQRIELTGEQARALVGGPMTFTATGRLCEASGCGGLPLPPFPQVVLVTRLDLVMEIGGES